MQSNGGAEDFNGQPPVLICLLICQSPSLIINTTKMVTLLTTIALYICYKIIKLFHMRCFQIRLIIHKGNPTFKCITSNNNITFYKFTSLHLIILSLSYYYKN